MISFCLLLITVKKKITVKSELDGHDEGIKTLGQVNLRLKSFLIENQQNIAKNQGYSNKMLRQLALFMTEYYQLDEQSCPSHLDSIENSIFKIISHYKEVNLIHLFEESSNSFWMRKYYYWKIIF